MSSTKLALALVFFLCAGSASADSISYVGDISTPCGNDDLLAVVQTPSTAGGNPPLFTTVGGQGFCQYSGPAISANPYGTPFQVPTAIKLNQNSFLATQWNGQQLSGNLFSTETSQLFTFNFSTDQLTLPSPFIKFINNQADSIAVSQTGQVTMIADTYGYLVNTTTGAGTVIFTIGGGTAPGEFSSALYQSYGPDGLLYILDYGNGRVQSLDPANNYAPVAQFNLESGVTTANMQFAISNNGNLYFGDGDGGGTAYSSNGTFLGAFSSGETATVDSGQSYVSVDGEGDVYVFDSTGEHEFLDSPSVPEPSTISLMLIGIAGAVFYRKRRA